MYTLYKRVPSSRGKQEVREKKKREKKNGGSLQSIIVAVTGGRRGGGGIGGGRTGKGTPNQLRENHPFARSTDSHPFASLHSIIALYISI